MKRPRSNLSIVPIKNFIILVLRCILSKHSAEAMIKLIENEEEPSIVLTEYDAAYFCASSSVTCEVTWTSHIDVNGFDTGKFEMKFNTFLPPYNEDGQLSTTMVRPYLLIAENTTQAQTVSRTGDLFHFFHDQHREQMVGFYVIPEFQNPAIYSDPLFNENESFLFDALYHPANSTTVMVFHRLVPPGSSNRNKSALVQVSCTGLNPIRLLTDDNTDYLWSSGSIGSTPTHSLPRKNWTPCQEGAHRITQWNRTFYETRPRAPVFNPQQQRVRAISMLISGLVSFTASSYLVFAILVRWRKNKRSTTRDRILLGMSVIDVFNSFSLAMGPLLSPTDTITLIWNSGNDALCSIQGFGIQMGFGVPIYNAMLCIFFLMVIIFEQNTATIQNRYEWIFHLCAGGFALSSAVTGAVMKLYNPNGTFCWIGPGPYNCKYVEWLDCTSGEDAERFQWMFAGYPLIASLILIFVTMAWIYISVWYRGFVMKQRYGNSNSSAADLSRQTAIQASLFVLALLMTYGWGFTIQLLQTQEKKQGFWLHATNAFFMPLQGFWNFFIFIRLTYAKERRTNPEKSWFWALGQAVQKESIHYTFPRENRRMRRRLSQNLSRSQRSFDSSDTDRTIGAIARAVANLPGRAGITLSRGRSSKRIAERSQPSPDTVREEQPIKSSLEQMTNQPPCTDWQTNSEPTTDDVESGSTESS